MVGENENARFSIGSLTLLESRPLAFEISNEQNAKRPCSRDYPRWSFDRSGIREFANFQNSLLTFTDDGSHALSPARVSFSVIVRHPPCRLSLSRSSGVSDDETCRENDETNGLFVS